MRTAEAGAASAGGRLTVTSAVPRRLPPESGHQCRAWLVGPEKSRRIPRHEYLLAAQASTRPATGTACGGLAPSPRERARDRWLAPTGHPEERNARPAAS